MRAFFIICTFLVHAASIAQVGVNTTEPAEMLHVNGTMVIETTDPNVVVTSLVGADLNGTLSTVVLENTLDIVNNTLVFRRGITYGIGSVDISGIIPIGPNFVHNLDLLLGPGEMNEGKTVIKVFNSPGNFKLTGIQDGIEGLRIFFVSMNTSTIQFMDQTNSNSLLSLPANRINVLAGSETISGDGSVELIYDGTAQKWLFLSIHD